MRWLFAVSLARGKTRHAVPVVSLALAAAYVAVTVAYAADVSIQFVPTRHDVVTDMLWLAGVGKDDVVYDLGSGDGRILIAAVRDFGARKAIGVEHDPALVKQSRAAIEAAGLRDRVEVLAGDLFAQDVSQASVVILYLGHQPNIDLRAKLCRSLKPGARIVAHQFGMGEWPPDKLLRVRTPYLGMYGVVSNPFTNNPRVPDFADLFEPATFSSVRVWIVPEPVAGVWRGRLATIAGERELRLVLHQRIGEVSGTARIVNDGDSDNGVRADLWGDHIRLDGSLGRPAGKPYFDSLVMLDGHVRGDTLEAKVATFAGGERREREWTATREPQDFAGVWEWACPTGSRTVQLRIERHDGQLSATYVDGEKKATVSDFYDFGGGFYFTHLIGRQPNGSLEITRESGWLIGEAVMDGDVLSGTIDFYPYSRSLGEKPKDEREIKAGPQPWQPKRVAN